MYTQESIYFSYKPLFTSRAKSTAFIFDKMTKTGLVTRTFKKDSPIGVIAVDEKTIKRDNMGYSRKIDPLTVQDILDYSKEGLYDFYGNLKSFFSGKT